MALLYALDFSILQRREDGESKSSVIMSLNVIPSLTVRLQKYARPITMNWHWLVSSIKISLYSIMWDYGQVNLIIVANRMRLYCWNHSFRSKNLHWEATGRAFLCRFGSIYKLSRVFVSNEFPDVVTCWVILLAPGDGMMRDEHKALAEQWFGRPKLGTSNMDWPKIEPGDLWWEASDWLLRLKHVMSLS